MNGPFYGWDCPQGNPPCNSGLPQWQISDSDISHSHSVVPMDAMVLSLTSPHSSFCTLAILQGIARERGHRLTRQVLCKEWKRVLSCKQKEKQVRMDTLWSLTDLFVIHSLIFYWINIKRVLVHTVSGSVLGTGGVTVNKEEKFLEVLQLQLLVRANKR